MIKAATTARNRTIPAHLCKRGRDIVLSPWPDHFQGYISVNSILNGVMIKAVFGSDRESGRMKPGQSVIFLLFVLLYAFKYSEVCPFLFF